MVTASAHKVALALAPMAGEAPIVPSISHVQGRPSNASAMASVSAQANANASKAMLGMTALWAQLSALGIVRGAAIATLPRSACVSKALLGWIATHLCSTL